MRKRNIGWVIMALVAPLNLSTTHACDELTAVASIKGSNLFMRCIKEFDKYFSEQKECLSFESKSDGSLVSNLEKKIENHFGEMMQEETPWASFKGEEGYYHEAKITDGENTYCWYVDPIDGTISFRNDLDTFAFTLSLVKNREPLASLIYLPTKAQAYFAYKGQGAFCNNLLTGEENKLVIKDHPLERSHIVARSDDYAFKYLQRENMLSRCQDIPAIVRTYTDAFAYTQVAAGKYKAKIDAAAALWDLYPVYLLTREAGGEFVIYLAENPTSDLFCSCLAGPLQVINVIRSAVERESKALTFVNQIPSLELVECND